MLACSLGSHPDFEFFYEFYSYFQYFKYLSTAAKNFLMDMVLKIKFSSYPS
ncbi:hypothetical protein Bbad01_32520 [Bacillus badius]|nr:hypothetical protein Bbad01_32520 [Bacillus badius]